MKANVIGFENGEAVGEVELLDSIYSLRPFRPDLVYRVIHWQMAKARSGTHKTKTRGEVSYSTRKIYRQKGTGGARHGSRGVVQFRHGGTTKGPIPRSYEYSLPKKIRSLGLKHALSSKLAAGRFLVLDFLQSSELGTGIVKNKVGELLEKHANSNVSLKERPKLLFVNGGTFERNFHLSARNVPGFRLLPVMGMNVYDVINSDFLLLTLSATLELNERLQ
jgi:large subunit ribosomal protein L4